MPQIAERVRIDIPATWCKRHAAKPAVARADAEGKRRADGAVEEVLTREIHGPRLARGPGGPEARERIGRLAR